MKTCSVLAIACLSLLATACGSKEENLQEESLELMRNAADVLKDVEDVESAKAAEPKLEKIGKRMSELADDLFNAITLEQQEAFVKSHETEIKEVLSALMKEEMRIGSNPELAMILGRLGDQTDRVLSEDRSFHRGLYLMVVMVLGSSADDFDSIGK